MVQNFVKKVIVIVVLAIVFSFIIYRQTHKEYYDYIIMSGATPIAVSQRVPSDISLEIDGFVKKKYHLTGDALNALATTRIRTREISPAGKYTGAYIHLGIPAFNILEGISPEKPDHFTFDGPIDILVTFHSASGEISRFSFNEIIMTDDRYPVTLAYHRKELLPTNEEVRKSYTANLNKKDLNGLRLICPREPDTSRYLDNVVRISYSVVAADEEKLPVRRKKYKCESTSVKCMGGDGESPCIFKDVIRNNNSHWLRVGHGHGFTEASIASGYDLRSFLTTNFPQFSYDDFFLFIACDGYRALFSGREIFSTDDGAGMIIIDHLDGNWPRGGYMLGPTRDYFSDRAMWGFTNVVWIPHDKIGGT